MLLHLSFILVTTVCLFGQDGMCQSQRLSLGISAADVRHYSLQGILPDAPEWNQNGRFRHLDLTIWYHPNKWVAISASAPMEFAYKFPDKYYDIRPATFRLGPQFVIKKMSVSPVVCGAILGGYDSNRPYFEYARGLGGRVAWHFSKSVSLDVRFDYLWYRELSTTSGKYLYRREKNTAIGLQFNLWKIPEEPTKFDRWLTEKRSKLRKQPD